MKTCTTRKVGVCQRFWCLGFLFLLIPLSGSSKPIINEILFHPPSHGTNDEFIELFNTGPDSVDLFGWRLSQGVDYMFSNHWVLPAGGYLVVAADTNTFKLHHPSVSSVVGNWIGTLSNSGETLQLADDQGVLVDVAAYASSGDFAHRKQARSSLTVGWVYESEANGQGSSLERIRADESGLIAQNWAESFEVEGSPGAENSSAAQEIAPFISGVRHFPAVPRSKDPMTITCSIGSVSSRAALVQLFYRSVSTGSPGPFTQLTMLDDGQENDGLPGDGVYGVVISPQVNRTVLEFFVQVVGSNNLVRTWPPPATDILGVVGQFANALLQVQDLDREGNQPFRFLVMSESDRRVLQDLPATDYSSNAEMNSTFIEVDGDDIRIRYGCGLRLRGASSRYSPPSNLRLSIPSDRRWKGLTAVNFNAHTINSQIAGYAMATRAGLVTEEHLPVQVRINGVNVLQSMIPGSTVYAQAEVPDGDFASHHFPFDPDGNVYRASSRSHNADLAYLGSNEFSYLAVGYSKTTHQIENDWSDLFQLTQTLANTNQSTFVSQLRKVANIPQWLTYFAVFSLTGSTETSLGTGVGDDFEMYRGVIDKRFQLLGHDWDSVLGVEYDSSDASVFQATQVPSVSAFLKHPEIAPLYYAELLRQLENTFEPGHVARLLDETIGPWTDSKTVLDMKRYATNRAIAATSQIPMELRWLATRPNLIGGTSFPRVGLTNVTLSGISHASRTRSVLVRGVPAQWSAWEGRWTNSLALSPGFNSVLIQSLDENGMEFARTNVTLLFLVTNGPALTGTLSTNTILEKRGGPFRVQGNWVVPEGVTLTIQPGTTLLFDADASLTVRGTLNASGSETQKIFCSRSSPALVQSNWGGIQFVGPGTRHQLSYVVLDSAGSQGPCLRATNVVLEIDHLEIVGSTRTSLAVSNCSLTLTDSSLPVVTDEFVISASGIPADGVMFIARNQFAYSPAAKDVLRVSGGRRPGPILELIDNQFLGSGDDLVELTDADAHIEGNLFANLRKNIVPDGSDLSAAVAIVGAIAKGSAVTVARNVFINDDYGVLSRDGSRLTLQNNTFLSIKKGAVSLDEPGRRSSGAQPGAGVVLENNIVWMTPTNLAFLSVNDPVFGTTEVQSRNNLFSGLDLPAGGVATLQADPLFFSAKVQSSNAVTLRQAVVLQRGSSAIHAGADGRDLGNTVAAGLATSREFPPVTTSHQERMSVTGAGYTRYRWSLDEGSWTDPVALSSPLVLNNLSDGPHRLSALGQNSAGRWDGAPVVLREWRVQTGVSRVVINEVLALNQSAFANDGAFPDALELYNPGDQPVLLEGMGLTDDLTIPHRFSFPVGAILPAGGYQIVFADSRKGAGFHTRFGLRAEGGGLYLTAPPDTNSVVIDQIAYGFQIPDKSIGRRADGTWGLSEPTLGLPNKAAAEGNPLHLLINEWLANAASDDFLELYNPDPLPIALDGLSLTDDPMNFPARERLVPLSYVAGLGLRTWTADGSASGTPGHLSFRLRKEGGSLSLHAADGRVIDCFLYAGQGLGVSQGRSPSGATRFGFFAPPTPGAPNPPPPPLLATNLTTSGLDLFSMTNQSWRYRQDNVDLGTAWRLPSYNDTTWLTGLGIFGIEDCGCLPAPIQTPLQLQPPGQPSPVITYYFRTSFVLPELYTNNTVLKVSAVYDDAFVLYVNGREVGRRGLFGNVSHTQFAPIGIAPEGTLATIAVAATNFVAGTNWIAVEVHQSDTVSGDVVMGMSLRADRTVTNFFRTQGVVLNEILANNASLAHPDGSITDWVEVHNIGKAEVDLSDMSLTDNSKDPRRWVFPAGVRIAPETDLVVRMDSATPASVQTEPVLNSGFGLSSQGDQLFLFDATARGGALLDSVQFGVQAANFSIGRTSFNTNTWVLNIPTPGSANVQAQLGDPFFLRLNEWMASPSSGDDWFEIYNADSQPLNLSGLYLTQDLTRRTLHAIPNLSFVGVGSMGGFVQFIADGTPAKGASHIPFKLSAQGETLAIFHSDGSTAIDIRPFGPQQKGVSEGRFPDGSEVLESFPKSPTPGAANFIPFTDVRVNEVIVGPPQSQSVELWNTTAQDQLIGGWWLSTDESEPRQFRIPPQTVIPAGGFFVLSASDLQTPSNGGRSLVLDPERTRSVLLSVSTASGELTGLRNQLRTGSMDLGDSVGVFQTSVGFESPILQEPTLGANNALPKVGPVVINEIYYHPKGTADEEGQSEFVELYNVSDAAVVLGDVGVGTNVWHLRHGVDLDLPTAFSIPARGFVLLVGFDPATNALETAGFRARLSVPQEVPLLGPWNGRLANSGDTLELNRPGTPIGAHVSRVIVDKVAYRDVEPWPISADGLGNALNYSLQRDSARTYGNEPTNWVAATPTAGRANQASPQPIPSITSSAANLTLPEGSSATLSVIAAGALPLHFQWIFNGVDISSATNSSYKLTAAGESDEGTYSVRVSNPWGAAWGVQGKVSVLTRPRVTRQPESLVTAPGESAILSVGARGTAPLHYQWMRDSQGLPGENQYRLKWAALQLADLGNYRVVVSNAFGAVTSAVAVVELASPPRFLQQPLPISLAVNEGAEARFFASVTGSAPLRVQWRHNGAPIRDATNVVMVLPHVRASDAGVYTLQAGNPQGVVMSDPASLSVRLAPLLSITSTVNQVSEPGTLEWVIKRSGSNDIPFEVKFGLTGTATPGVDYALPAQPLIFPAGVNAITVKLAVFLDGKPESDEDVVFTLFPTENYGVTTQRSARATILDIDNHPPTVVAHLTSLGFRFPLSPTNVVIEFEAQDSDIGDAVKGLWAAGNDFVLLGLLTNAPYRFVWTNPPPGTNVVLGYAVDQWGAVGRSQPLVFTVNQPPTVTWLQPFVDEVWTLTSPSVLLEAQASDADGSIASVRFYLDEQLVGVVSKAPYSLGLPRPARGPHSVKVLAMDNEGQESIPVVREVTVGDRPSRFQNMFGSRGLITAESITLTPQNNNATLELGEPIPFRGTNSSRSLWIEWIAPADGVCTIDTLGSRGSSGAPFDTVLASYLGDRLSSLWELGSDDDGGERDSNGFGTSVLRFTCEAGVAYQLRLNAYEQGTVTFHLALVRATSVEVSGDAVEQRDLLWRTRQSSPWLSQTSVTLDGVDAFKTGGVTDSDASWVETMVQGPAALSFRWIANGSSITRDGYTYRDHFVLRVGNAAPLDLTQNFAWVSAQVVIPAGPQRLRWSFIGAPSYSSGSRRFGFLDVVTLNRLKIQSSQRVGPGVFAFDLEGWSNAVFSVESSSNLVQWLPIFQGRFGVSGKTSLLLTNPIGSLPQEYFRSLAEP